jgi:hypothetical protein
MIWDTATKKLGIWLRPKNRAANDQREALTVDVEMPIQELPRSGEPKVRKLRRRLLSRKGAQLLVAMVDRQDKGMLSVLDVNGVVVFWHDGGQSAGRSDDVIDNHVAQFYAPNKHARTLAMDHLRQAYTQGGSSEFGWRRRADATVFWGVTTIEPLLLADGRLQGFTHVTRAVNEPREPMIRVQSDFTGLSQDAQPSRTLSFRGLIGAASPRTRFASPARPRYVASQPAFG